LASKLVVTVFSGLASKLVATVSLFEPQNRSLRFSDFGLKITMTVSWFWPQNQAGFGLSVVPQNRWREDGAGHHISAFILMKTFFMTYWISIG
jgi:hypothetical protein